MISVGLPRFREVGRGHQRQGQHGHRGVSHRVQHETRHDDHCSEEGAGGCGQFRHECKPAKHTRHDHRPQPRRPRLRRCRGTLPRNPGRQDEPGERRPRNAAVVASSRTPSIAATRVSTTTATKSTGTDRRITAARNTESGSPTASPTVGLPVSVATCRSTYAYPIRLCAHVSDFVIAASEAEQHHTHTRDD
jgi:hypothetical protein